MRMSIQSIVIIDDEANVINLFKKTLEMNGFDVSEDNERI